MSLLTVEGVGYMIFEDPLQCKLFYDSVACYFKHSRSACEGRCLYTYIDTSILIKRCLHCKNFRVSKLRVGQLESKPTEFVYSLQSRINVKALLLSQLRSVDELLN